MKKKKFFLLLLIILVGGFFRFFKLDWGQGFFFHPDEYHIVIAVGRLIFPVQLNPEFFSYGSFTVYLIYFTKLVLAKTLISINANPFLIGRFYSALFSTATIAVIFFLAKKLFKNIFLAYLTAILVALTPGLIQQAHFATPESNLTFFIFLAIYLLTNYLDTKKIKYFYFSVLVLGLAAGIKITALLLAPVFLLSLFMKRLTIKQYIKKAGNGVLGALIILATFFLVFPYSIIDFKGFQNSMKYESGVASGEQVVFYTRQFTNTTPLLFQIKKILPLTLGPVILLFGSLGFLLLIYNIIKDLINKKINIHWFIIALAFIAYFLPNSFLYAKWTRFIAPAFPFFAIFTAYSVSKLISKKYIFQTVIIFIIVTTLVWSLMFTSIYFKDDVRKTATEWVKLNLPQNSQILTEAGNTYEVPLTDGFDKISFDFYHLDEDPELPQRLLLNLADSDYFIIQSRRMYANHKDPSKFPVTSRFYEALFSNELGFRKIKEFNSYPSFFNILEIDDEKAEETWSVFDHPVIRIYEKVHPLSKNDYENILQF